MADSDSIRTPTLGAMKAATAILGRPNSGDFSPSQACVDLAAETIDREAVLPLVQALEAILADKVITGMSARIRVYASQEGRPDPLEIAKAAIKRVRQGE